MSKIRDKSAQSMVSAASATSVALPMARPVLRLARARIGIHHEGNPRKHDPWHGLVGLRPEHEIPNGLDEHVDSAREEALPESLSQQAVSTNISRLLAMLTNPRRRIGHR